MPPPPRPAYDDPWADIHFVQELERLERDLAENSEQIREKAAAIEPIKLAKEEAEKAHQVHHCMYVHTLGDYYCLLLLYTSKYVVATEMALRTTFMALLEHAFVHMCNLS